MKAFAYVNPASEKEAVPRNIRRKVIVTNPPSGDYLVWSGFRPVGEFGMIVGIAI